MEIWKEFVYINHGRMTQFLYLIDEEFLKLENLNYRSEYLKV